jgi:hypothetical protein
MERVEQWQNDWSVFCDVLSECLESENGIEMIQSRFGTKDVTWSGVLEEKDLGELALGVYIGLPQRHLSFCDGRTAIINGLALPITEDSIPLWKKITDGAGVTFRARMGRSDAVFPAISVKTYKSGRTTVTIALSGGIPVRTDG